MNRAGVKEGNFICTTAREFELGVSQTSEHFSKSLKYKKAKVRE